MKIYQIRDWDSLFETGETKKIVHLRWVPTPNKHDGKSFRRISNMKNGCEIFTAWMLILQIASKCKPRGTLIDGQTPITTDDMAVMTGFPEKIFIEALKVLSNGKIDWIQVVGSGDHPEASGDHPDIAGDSPVEGKEGREGKEKKGRPAVEDILTLIEIPESLKADCRFVELWPEWVAYRLKGDSVKDWHGLFKDQLTLLKEWGPVGAFESLLQAKAGAWKTFYKPKNLKLNPNI